MANRTPGWYPDPNDNSTEHYWDGAGWHGQRDARQPQRPKSAGITRGNAVQRYFDGLSQWEKVGAMISAVVAGFILLGLLINVVSWLSESDAREACEAEASRNGYSGAEFDQVVEFCIDYDEQFSGQS